MMKIKEQKKVDNAVNMYKFTRDYKNLVKEDPQIEEYIQAYFTQEFMSEDEKKLPVFIDFKKTYDELSKKYYQKVNQGDLKNLVNISNTPGKEKIKISEIEPQPIDPIDASIRQLEDTMYTENSGKRTIEAEVEKISEEIEQSKKRRDKIETGIKEAIKDSSKKFKEDVQKILNGPSEEEIEEASRKISEEYEREQFERKLATMNNLEAYSRIVKHHFMNGVDKIKEAFSF